MATWIIARRPTSTGLEAWYQYGEEHDSELHAALDALEVGDSYVADAQFQLTPGGAACVVRGFTRIKMVEIRGNGDGNYLLTRTK